MTRAAVRRHPRTLVGFLVFAVLVTLALALPVLAPLAAIGGGTAAGAALIMEVSTHARP